MSNKKASVIIKFDFSTEQTVGEITKIVGFVRAKFLIPMIDTLNLEANPRSSGTGSVTDAIQESIEKDPNIFPFKTKGILLASSQYERLERERIRITPDNTEIEGILDGGHNTLAIGLHILRKAMEYSGKVLPRGAKKWDAFKELWKENRNFIDSYLEALRDNPTIGNLNFFVPIELLVPRDADDVFCVESFKNDLMEICAARNNNVQLNMSDKANQIGYFKELKAFMEDHNPELNSRIEWKSNEGGDIKAQDIVALAWIPLNLVSPIKDVSGKIIEPVAGQKIYGGKSACMKQFERLMGSDEVTMKTSADYQRELRNREVCSALRIAVEIPELFDYIYEMFPKLYNAAGGSYGRITGVKNLNEKRTSKTTPFTAKEIDTLSPDGYIVPLVYGLQALMENKEVEGCLKICWKQPPMEFLQNKLGKIVERYIGIFSMCDYDPQKIGKNPQSYNQALDAYKMALANII